MDIGTDQGETTSLPPVRPTPQRWHPGLRIQSGSHSSRAPPAYLARYIAESARR